MDRLKRFALNNVAKGLDKVLEAKAHFDKKEAKKTYTQKVNQLKKRLSEVVFSDQGGDKSEAWNYLTKLERLTSEHELLDKDKKMIDEMYNKYM